MGQKIVETGSQWIDFRLNQLGIRVWENACQLISKQNMAWVTLGPVVELPVMTPRNGEELTRAWADPIRMTAFQIMQDHPDSPLEDILLRNKALREVLQVTKNHTPKEEECLLV